MRTFLIKCLVCHEPFSIDATSMKDCLRKLGATTNCLRGYHLALPTLLQHVDVNSIQDLGEKEEKLFQSVDTNRIE